LLTPAICSDEKTTLLRRSKLEKIEISGWAFREVDVTLLAHHNLEAVLSVQTSKCGISGSAESGKDTA